MTDATSSAAFTAQFEALTGFSPMGWQRRLFKRFVDAGLPGQPDIPRVCDLPTGLGKTSVIIIWLLALVHQAKEGQIRIARRLVYVVNRRTVVDQATETVERIRHRLLEPETPDWREHADTLKGIASVLCELCASDGAPLGISTLRGELADNEEWKVDPARPAIVVGTVDMIGSKLLFCGYGDGRYGRAHHAGLIGYNALIVHDEAHLTPAFSGLLQAVAEEQARETQHHAQHAKLVRPIRVLELSATSREGEQDTFAIHSEDERDRIVKDRLAASKRLYLHAAEENEVIECIVELARSYEAASAKVLIYIRSPEQAQDVASKLAKVLGTYREDRVALLTGTVRGHERDLLVQANPVYRALLDPDVCVAHTVYLVSTSAGEVGIDLDADHLVCDLTTLDALIQRLGRVNRRGGESRSARVDVVGAAPNREKSSRYDAAVMATLGLLKHWGGESNDGIDVSPGNLRKLVGGLSRQDVEAAFSPRPQAHPPTDILLDKWSLTSIREMPGRPDVAPFLHGITWDPPETFVVWRTEIEHLATAGVDDATLGEWFRSCRIEARERLRDRTDRVRKALDSLLKKHRRRDSYFDVPLALLDERGGARWSRLSEIVSRDFDINYRTLVLPIQGGGLDRNGLLDPSAVVPTEGWVLDVGNVAANGDRRERWLHYRSEGYERYEPLLGGDASDSPPKGLREKERLTLRQPEEGTGVDETVDLVLFVSPRRSAIEGPETASVRQTLEEHTKAIVMQMDTIATRLGIPDEMRSALITAAQWHDRGKARPIWQRYARNEGGDTELAKSPRYLHPRALGGYRHEFGSLLEAMADRALFDCSERDLVLHLIAAHHGWARPHFEPRSHDSAHTSSKNDQATWEVMRRFGRLQERFGRWGLAWLESLLRCADIAASQQAVEAAMASEREEAEA